jgi:site-specific DNA-cytosine methylase
MEAFHIQYGVLIPSKAFKSPIALPQDINLVSSDNLLKLGAYDQDTQWMVVAGWECQDISPAGQGKELAGPRSTTFYPLINLCAIVKLLQPAIPPAILFENTAMQNHKDPSISVRDFEVICSIIGQQVLLNAARFGAGAHRLQFFWTNLALPDHLTCCTENIHRNPYLSADMWLDPGRETITADHSDFNLFYPCNEKDERRRAFPTLVAFPISRDFRDLNGGTV